MPSLWKRITFSVASVLCVVSVVLLVVALSTERWVSARILCKTGAEIVNASHPELEQFIGDIYYGLFQGRKTKKCGLGKRRSRIYGKIKLEVQTQHHIPLWFYNSKKTHRFENVSENLWGIFPKNAAKERDR